MPAKRQACRAPLPRARLGMKLRWRAFSWNYRLRSGCRGATPRRDREHLESSGKNQVTRGADPAPGAAGWRGRRQEGALGYRRVCH